MALATTLIAFPAMVIVITHYFYKFHEKHNCLPAMEQIVLKIQIVRPHCFFIDFFLIAFGYLFFVN